VQFLLESGYDRRVAATERSERGARGGGARRGGPAHGRQERSRQERGERRRAAIVQAALAVIGERGVAATTHRAVAERAGVPLSATTYYFESLDQLLDEALAMFVRDEADRLKALTRRLDGASVAPMEIARMLLAELRTNREPGAPTEVAQFELYLEASRRPGLREVARAALDQYAEVAEAALRAAGARRPAEGARAFVAMIDGLGLHRIASGREGDTESALRALFIAHAMDGDELAKWEERLG
jgi:TetR/AcrR family transcriptional regulator, regulator of biofilm formation and stress response